MQGKYSTRALNAANSTLELTHDVAPSPPRVRRVTTIVARDGVMASDTQCTGHYMMRVEKLYRLPDGGVVGGSGGSRESYAAIRWMLAGEAGEPPVSGDGDNVYDLLILRPDGTLWLANNGFPSFRLFDKFAAIGSGCHLAMAAMDMGATATQAVKIAAKYDENTNDKVKSLAIEPAARKRGKQLFANRFVRLAK